MSYTVHAVFYGNDLEMRGLYLDNFDKIDIKGLDPKSVRFIPGDRYIIVYNDLANTDDEQPHKWIEKYHGIHYGPRSENFYDYTKAPYLTTRDGIYFKFIYKKYSKSTTWLTEDQYNQMLPTLEVLKTRLRNADLVKGISKRTGQPYFKLEYDKLKDADTGLRDFCEKVNFIKTPPELKYSKRCRTRDEITSAFEYFLSKPDGTIFGFDYETSFDFPMEGESFRIMGLGIACCDESATAAYFDAQWMQNHGQDGEFELFKDYLNKYLDRFENSVTYNNSFEQKATYVLLGRLVLFDEGATINKCQGRVAKRFSLKYTTQVVNGTWSYDDDFDRLTGELLPELFGWDESTETYKWTLTDEFDENGDLKGNMIELVDGDGNIQLEMVSTKYTNNPIWKDICNLYPDEVEEFISLIEFPGNYGYVFSCVPSNLQTYYCCRDAFYTGHLKITALQQFSQLCYDTYNHNLQLEALLHLTGFFCDEDLRLKMELQCLWLEVYGKLNVTQWILAEKLRWFKDISVPEVPGVSDLIRAGYDPCDSKSIIMNHLSDVSDSGLDEDVLRDLLGQEVLDIYIDYIRDYCCRIDESYRRSRKVFTELNNALTEYYNPEYGDDYCKYVIKGVEYQINIDWDMLMDYYSTKSNYEMIKVFTSQLKFKEIEKLVLPHLGSPKLPTKFYGPKNTKFLNVVVPESYFCGYIDPSNVEYDEVLDEYSLDDILDFCDDCYNYKSAKYSPYFKFMAFNKFKATVYKAWSSDYEPIPFGNSVPLTDELLETVRGMEFNVEWADRRAHELIQEDLENLKQTQSWKYYRLNKDIMSLLYKGIMEETRVDEYGRSVGLFQLTPTGEYDDDKHPLFGWSSAMDEWFDTVSTELGGWFDFIPRYIGYWSLTDDDRDRLCSNIDDVDIEGDTVESLAKLNYCFTSAKKYDKVLGSYLRGESFYTHNYDVQYFDENGVTPNLYEETGVHKCHIPFYACSKKSKRWSSGYHTIPSKAEAKRIITTPPGYLMSYFDISGAEIRTISFMSEDEFMMNCYKEDKDPYITMASYTFPREYPEYSKMSDDEYMDFLKSWRGSFKQVLLGSLYGMGVDKMADLAEISVEEAQRVMDDLWKRCPGLKKFIEQKSQWAQDHPGYVQSALGDVLELGDDDGDDRLARLGINQFIQNYSSVSLGDGFMNVIEKSIHHSDEVRKEKDFILRPMGVVHDSCQILFKTKYLFEMQEYYERNLSGYLFDLHKILYAFDLEVGTNYYDTVSLKSIDATHIQMGGNYTSLKKMIDKCREDGLQFKINWLRTNPKHGDPIDIPVDGFNLGEDFKPKYPTSIIKQFFDYNCYAKFCEDNSKFKIQIEKL